jgi:hypothetical protein
MTMTNSEITWVLLAAAVAVTLVGALIARRRSFALRPIAAYTLLPDLMADAVESDQGVHFSTGSAALGQTSTVSALASAELIYRLASRLAVGERSPLITLSDPVTLLLAQDTLRRAYTYRQRQQAYRVRAAAWFPQGRRSLAFAAGASSLAADADVSTSILLGRFGAELALFGASAVRHDQRLIAHSDLVEGQAVAFAQADRVLIGEELYAGAAYMDGRPVDVGGVVAQDVLRWVVIVAIIVAAIQAAL